MVKTLFKYEFKAYARTLLPMNGILLVIALINRLIQFMENDHFSYDIMFGFSLAALIISALFLVAFTFIFAITRYYKNMFSNEGYLTMTLPVTPAQHIFTKLVTVVIFTVVTVISVILSACIATSGELLVEFVKAFNYLAGIYFDHLHAHGAFYILEGVILVIISIASGYLMFYTCMTVGQLAKKNRVLMSFGVYFGIYIISQILSAIITTAFIELASNGALDGIVNFMVDHKFAFSHIVFIVLIFITLVVDALYWFITHRILKNKLNLE